MVRLIQKATWWIVCALGVLGIGLGEEKQP
jgi:hypothetical protein